MLLFKAAKLATGLRLLIVTAAPIITSSAALLSVRSAAYLGFFLTYYAKSIAKSVK
jgi:hypothetical protein